MASAGVYETGNMAKQLSILLIAAALLAGCRAGRQFPGNYYFQHEQAIIAIEKQYAQLTSKRLISLGFTDGAFRHVLTEMKTDSIRYVYEFNLSDPSFADTLTKYGYNAATCMSLLQHMKAIKCTWINKLDYYTDKEAKLLTFMSIRNNVRTSPFSPEKYFILTFYQQPQYYDENGVLLDRRNLRRARKVNNEIFYRINEKVCYTVSAKFR